MRAASASERLLPGATVRILHLDDNPEDQELIRQKLLTQGIPAEITAVCTAVDFERALTSDAFDLILSDYTVPGYDGSAAMVFAQLHCPDVPYIFVSGTIGEERAIDCIKHGATDYVLKDRLDRLPAAIRRALVDVEQRRQRRAAERAWQESEERLQLMAENIREVFWISAPDGQLVYVSRAYLDIWGRPVDEVRRDPRTWIDAVIPEDRPRLQSAREQVRCGQPCTIEYRISRPDGSVRWVEDRGYPVRDADGAMHRIVGTAIDITERKTLEAQLQHAQKLEAVGQLAGGMAHDFNNVLTVINGYARLMLDREELPPFLVEPMRHIFAAGNRAASLTRQMLLFSRRQPADRRLVDLNAIVDEMGGMLTRLITEKVGLRLEPAASQAILEADAGMMEQIIMNLALNARDAMPDGGTLVIGTEQVTLDAATALRHRDARPGNFICLRVADSGCGIAPEIMGRIFEPFFTTKEPGRGTGLGLATAYGIVRQHEGWIEVESAPGKGSCFRVFLPASDRQLPESSGAADGGARVASGSETVLLIEDDSAVREFAAAVLRTSGYRVLQAANGADALETWKWHGTRIALVFTDVVVPQCDSGIALAEQLRAQKPSLKVVLTSGYAVDAATGLRCPAGMRFIQKPYKPSVLAETIRDALDEVGT